MSLRSIARRFFSSFLNFIRLGDSLTNVSIGCHSKLYHRCALNSVSIGNYSYIGRNSYVDNTSIGNFCSIGPNFTCGLGIHPINGISTAPCFYSTRRQCGVTFSKEDKIKETEPVIIGNDVFIGANVTILSGITIGDGAVLAAGAVVTKNVPPYAVVGGCPAKLIKYRFDEETRDILQRIKWWNWPEDKLINVEQLFNDPHLFIGKFNS